MPMVRANQCLRIRLGASARQFYYPALLHWQWSKWEIEHNRDLLDTRAFQGSLEDRVQTAFNE